VTAKWLKSVLVAGVTLATVVTAGCGDYVRESRSPSQLVMVELVGASGAEPDKFGGTLYSDVVTLVKRDVNGQQQEVPTTFSDNGRVTLRLILRDPGSPGVTTAPSELNAVTINRYRVVYRRADGRNTPGVDVPFPFDSAITFTVSSDGTFQMPFEIVRHVAKEEAPLLGLTSAATVISTIAEVTFYGRDQAGNDIAATGTIGIEFGNFGDPQ
jgi:hypothetical protein